MAPDRGFLRALFHPDYTVGSGIAPDLLTFQAGLKAAGLKALAGSGHRPIPPVGTCTPP